MPALVLPGPLPSSALCFLCLSRHSALLFVFVCDLCTHDSVACLLTVVRGWCLLESTPSCCGLVCLLVSCMFVVCVRCPLIRACNASAQAFLAAQTHFATKWFNDGVEAGATILVMSAALERLAALSPVYAWRD